MNIIECVTNYSEGREKSIIEHICSAIGSVEGVRVLHCDAGYAVNRTVVTFAGEANAVCEAAFRGARCATELIDMRLQSGEHPRLGAVDVLPLIPLEGVTLEQCALLARELAQRLSRELSIPTYCYQAAALRSERRNLAVCRRGEYEALAQRVEGDDAPDYGVRPFDEAMARTGATNVGARDFLLAVNFNIDSVDASLAHAIACDVRESSGRRGALKSCKAIGWYIEEYGLAQVSTNLTNISLTPLHVAFEAISHAATQRGTRVTAVEIIGLLPRRVLTEAGAHFSGDDSSRLSQEELMERAIERMNLSWRMPFNPRERVIEYLLGL